MEMMILSILSPALYCEWEISTVEQAMITTCVFSGMMLSSTVWGKICDRFGRRTVCNISALEGSLHYLGSDVLRSAYFFDGCSELTCTKFPHVALLTRFDGNWDRGSATIVGFTAHNRKLACPF